jgi:hypothetical protein
MTAIPLKDAIEQLAQAVEQATPDDLAAYHSELFPEKPLPVVNGTNSASMAKKLAKRIRTGIEADEVVDLWNVVFPISRHAYYNEVEDALLPTEREVRYAEE